MSNPQENSNKNLTGANSTKTIKKNKKWTLLLVGNHGEIISVRNFIWVMSALLIALVIAVTAAVSIFFIYKNAENEAESLKSTFQAVQNQVLSLKEEKDLLMVRLVVAEEENKALTSKSKTETPLQHKNKQSVKKIKKKHDIKSAITADKKVTFKMAIDNFAYSISADNRIIKTEFKLINKSSKSRAASGYTFVLLKNNKIDKNKWLISPQIALLSGKPVQFKKGRFFSISRYNIIKFRQKVPKENIESFNEAIVFVYASNGDLLLEKIFPFSIKLNPSKAKVDKKGHAQKVLSGGGAIQPGIVKTIDVEESEQVTKPDGVVRKPVDTKSDMGE
ncbi:MAG: hypothetical protein JJV92_04655 [Desulfosarcina sp.]|nr:hypothetical protein [Desulfobacterales bacterium]